MTVCREAHGRLAGVEVLNQDSLDVFLSIPIPISSPVPSPTPGLIPIWTAPSLLVSLLPMKSSMVLLT